MPRVRLQNAAVRFAGDLHGRLEEPLLQTDRRHQDSNADRVKQLAV